MADRGCPQHLIIKVFKSLKVVNLLDTQLVSSLSFRRKEEIISVFFVFFFFVLFLGCQGKRVTVLSRS